MNASDNFELDRAAELIDRADALVIAAGAGMGVDSGLPDFRGVHGFWKAYPALQQAGLTFTAAANPGLFRSDPALAWGFYGHRLQLYRTTRPHRGFATLLRWGAAKAHGAFVFTSNVDGQFQVADFDPQHIVECHGSIHYLQCVEPCSPAIWPADDLEVSVDAHSCTWQGPLPRCPHCGAMARPNILMFGDSEWLDERTDDQTRRLTAWLREASRIVVIEVGAGRAVPTVRHFSEALVARRGASLIRINPLEASVPTGSCIGLALGAVNAMEALAAKIYTD